MLYRHVAVPSVRGTLETIVLERWEIAAILQPNIIGFNLSTKWFWASIISVSGPVLVFGPLVDCSFSFSSQQLGCRRLGLPLIRQPVIFISCDNY